MEDTLISFETAKLAKEKGFNWEGQVVFDLKQNNFIVNFKDIAIKTFIDDCETGYRDKALNYFKEDIIRTDDNTDEGYYILAPTQSLLQKWLREVHNCFIDILPHRDGDSKNKQRKNKEDVFWTVEVDYYGKNFEIELTDDSDFTQHFNNSYEEALEIGLQEALKLIK